MKRSFVEESRRRGGAIPPWKEYPYRLVSWWDMAKFDGSTFCLLCSHFRALEKSWKEKREVAVSPESLRGIIGDLEYLKDQCSKAGLHNSAGYISDHVTILVDGVNYGYIDELFGNFPFQMRSEMKRVEFLTVDKPEFYGDAPLFDSFVTDVYPILSYDIVEAGNCLALDRTTACVFHLMRIVEFGVQRFGDKLGVPLVNESVWQKIMDQVNKHISMMPDKPAAKKRIKETYAEIAGHLYNVKVAWRNPVMHPKRTYTPQEAERLFDTVRTFMEILITTLRPKTVNRMKQLYTLGVCAMQPHADGTGTPELRACVGSHAIPNTDPHPGQKNVVATYSFDTPGIESIRIDIPLTCLQCGQTGFVTFMNKPLFLGELKF